MSNQMARCCQFVDSEGVGRGCESGHCCGAWSEYVDDKQGGVISGQTTRVSGIDDKAVSC